MTKKVKAAEMLPVDLTGVPMGVTPDEVWANWWRAM